MGRYGDIMRRRRRRSITCLARAAVVAAAISIGGAATGHGAQQPSSQGEAVFSTKCAACHTIGSGKLVGPDLKDVTLRRDREWLRRWISAPDRMLAGRDPIASQLLAEYGTPMPNMGLTAAEVEAVLAYLDEHSSTAPAASAGPTGQSAGPAGATPAAPSGGAAPTPGLRGDPLVGKQLFTGDRRFASGGPPCMACHSVAGLGALGGGALGPDLTPAYAKFGEPGLKSIVSSFPFPTMNPIFGSRPLTPQEQADVVAFLQQASASGRSPQVAGQLILLGGAGAAVLVATSHVVWRRRLTGVRRRLVEGRASSRAW